MTADYTEFQKGKFALDVHEVEPIEIVNTSGHCICTSPVGNQGLPIKQDSSGRLDVTITGGIVFTLENVAKGILPTTSVWDVVPTNLAKATDGDIDTATGTGTSVNKGAFNDYGRINLDLGSVKNVLIGGKVGIWSTIGDSRVYVAASTDGINYYITDTLLTKFNNVEEIGWLMSTNVVCRYIAFILTSNSNTTVNMKVYELMIYNLGSL